MLDGILVTRYLGDWTELTDNIIECLRAEQVVKQDNAGCQERSVVSSIPVRVLLFQDAVRENGSYLTRLLTWQVPKLPA